MSVLVFRYLAQVIRHAVRAVLGRQRVEKSDVGECGEARSEKPEPQRAGAAGTVCR